MTVSQLLAALASPSPTPGGGTAAAIAGAMGTSLLVMVAGLAKSKNNTDDEKAALSKARAAIEPITAQLTDLADADAASFDAVSGEQWERPGTRSDGATFTVETFARYFLHDPVHHLVDVGAG